VEDQIVLHHVTKRFTTKKLGTITAVNDFNLKVHEGECFSFLGPSGCGKTTTLRMIAGFEDLSEGEIELCGRLVSSKDQHLYVPPEERGLGMVFQAFAVWPHMNIFDNVAFPLQIRKISQTEIRKRVKEALHHTSLDGMEEVYPSDLSGGQQQRIALARAIVTNPKVMLLDEPLSNLDPKLRESMRFEIKALQQKFGFTIIFVTHDQSEAMAISDRMMVCDMGNIVQVGTPEELYNNPCNRFVHNFLGQSTFLHVTVKDGQVFARGDMNQPLPIPVPAGIQGNMVIATRPNELDLNREKGFATTIENRIFLTDMTQYIVRVGNQPLTIQTPHRITFAKGEPCRVNFVKVMWYPEEDEKEAAERAKRQAV
jgi:iron(III) transport system ATP-binding protein